MTDELVARWRKPPKILAVVEDSETGVRYDDRGWYRGVNFTTDREGYDRLRAGQVCMQCFEPQGDGVSATYFPEKCSLCGFEMNRLQPGAFEEEFLGEKKLGPSTSLSDELERLDHFAAERKWKKAGVAGLLVPRKLGN